jgi:hypothetical protein
MVLGPGRWCSLGNWNGNHEMLLGAALGSAATQGLHAQGKPKAYTVSELETLDAATNAMRPKGSGCAAGCRRSLRRAHRKHVSLR